VFLLGKGRLKDIGVIWKIMLKMDFLGSRSVGCKMG
jgi:hypothetical protein